jgi:hypothetical protein
LLLRSVRDKVVDVFAFFSAAFIGKHLALSEGPSTLPRPLREQKKRNRMSFKPAALRTGHHVPVYLRFCIFQFPFLFFVVLIRDYAGIWQAFGTVRLEPAGINFLATLTLYSGPKFKTAEGASEFKCARFACADRNNAISKS